ncbi:MAG: hypothetical protein JNM09_03365 [Blastocatellia bacterium]|nr:hypothetical protein [Blastocatellia bacterium]
MRDTELAILSKPYPQTEKGEVDRRFHSSIGADIPSASNLAREILTDLDTTNFGVSWWRALPTEERILISDYLYQCANGIELNLAEAKLHYWEWLAAKERYNGRIANAISRDDQGQPGKLPASSAPVDDLPTKLERMHICGFFRAIGSSLDCLGATIIGVLGLPVSLRRSDLRKAENALAKSIVLGTQGTQIQTDFQQFFVDLKNHCGPKDWLEWTDQYRNMFVHRGRRASYQQIKPKENLLFDAMGMVIPRATSIMYLAKYPDRSEIEALIKSKNIFLNEDASITLDGIFQSCRELEENTCNNLLNTWLLRRSDPALIEQPLSQWDDKIRNSDFVGYSPNAEDIDADGLIANPILLRRIRAASVDDDHRGLWVNSKWNQ